MDSTSNVFSMGVRGACSQRVVRELHSVARRGVREPALCFILTALWEKRKTMQCLICETPLDPVWAEIGVTQHGWCVAGGECAHGETRGSRYCALCRYQNPYMRGKSSRFVSA